MEIKYTNWSDYKTDILSKGFPVNYETLRDETGILIGYYIFALDRGILWVINLLESSDIIDFETNYKSDCNKLAIDLVAVDYLKPSYYSELISLTKGGLNKIAIKPRVMIENMCIDSNNLVTLGSDGIVKVGQVFRLTRGIDNVTRVNLVLDAVAGSALNLIDDFESYADTAALRTVWIPNDVTYTPNTLETTIIQEGIKAMKVIPTSSIKSKNDTIKRTYGSTQNWSNYTGIQFWCRQDANYTVEVRITDNLGNGSKKLISTSALSIYEFIVIKFSDMIPIGAIPVDLSAISSIEFYLATAGTSPTYIDRIELYSSAAYGTVDLQLYDFGINSSPTILGAPIETKTFNLASGGKQIYEIVFSKTGLTSSNYYGLVLANPSAATIKVYGKNTSDLYVNGFAFKSTDGTNIVTTGTGDDLYFYLFSLDQSVFNGIKFVGNASMGLSTVDVSIVNSASGRGKTVTVLGECFLNRNEAEYPIAQQTGVGLRLSKNDVVYINYDDDGGALATKVQILVYFTFLDRELYS